MVAAPVIVTGKATILTGGAIVKAGEATVRAGVATQNKGESLKSEWDSAAETARVIAENAKLEREQLRSINRLSKIREQEAMELEFARANGLMIDVTPGARSVEVEVVQPAGHAFA